MREWESDPLFAAAEVVQDSADRSLSLSLSYMLIIMVNYLNVRLCFGFFFFFNYSVNYFLGQNMVEDLLLFGVEDLKSS